MALPHLSEREMEQALEHQGFMLIKTNHGTRVLSPDGAGSSSWHPSTFDPGNYRSYRNMLGQLKRIGFDVLAATEPKSVKRAKTKPAPEPGGEIGNGEVAVAPTDASTDVSRPEEPAPEPGPEMSPDQRELYGIIVDQPGHKPMDYREKLGWDRFKVSRVGVTLRNAGLIDVTGQRAGTKYWPKGQAKTTAPPAPQTVRRRQVEPLDPTVRVRKLGETGTRQMDDLSATLRAIVEQFVAQEDELRTLRKKVKRFESIIGQALDQL